MFFQGIVVADSGNKGNDWWQWNNKKMQPLLAVSLNLSIFLCKESFFGYFLLALFIAFYSIVLFIQCFMNIVPFIALKKSH